MPENNWHECVQSHGKRCLKRKSLPLICFCLRRKMVRSWKADVRQAAHRLRRMVRCTQFWPNMRASATFHQLITTLLYARVLHLGVLIILGYLPDGYPQGSCHFDYYRYTHPWSFVLLIVVQHGTLVRQYCVVHQCCSVPCRGGVHGTVHQYGFCKCPGWRACECGRCFVVRQSAICQYYGRETATTLLTQWQQWFAAVKLQPWPFRHFRRPPLWAKM